MTVHEFQAGEERLKEAMDKAETIFRDHLQDVTNIRRRDRWRVRFHAATGIWPSYTTAYPTPNKEMAT